MNGHLLCLTFIAFVFQGVTVVPTGSERISGPPLELRLTVATERIAPGKRLSMEITIVNTGTVDLIVAERLVPAVNAPAYFEVLVSDEKGKQSPMETGIIEYSPRQRAHWWSRLSPGRSKTISWSISGKSHSFLNIPGKYQVHARYISRGADEWDEQLRTKKGEAISRSQIWSGEIRSKLVWIEVSRAR